MNSQARQAKEPSPTGEPIIDNSLQSTMRVANDNNHSFIEMQSSAMLEEAASFMTRTEVEAMLKKEKEKASASTVDLVLKPHYRVVIEAKPYLRKEGKKYERTCGVFPQFYVSELQLSHLCFRKFSKLK